MYKVDRVQPALKEEPVDRVPLSFFFHFAPMAYLLVRCNVKDFAEWKSVFDEHGETRRQNGSKGGYF